MGLPQTPSPPQLYPQSLQLKLYQAFIFSIPILFSIILFLLFYLFYLKRRASSLSLPTSRNASSSNQATEDASLAMMGLKGFLMDKLPVILFDADSRMNDPQCCVCLGEFEAKEELHQLPSCQHVFHKECIRHWFLSSSTCPLCRCPVIITTKTSYREQPATGPILVLQNDENSSTNHQVVQVHQQIQQGVNGISVSREQNPISAEESSGASTSVCAENGGFYSCPESVVLSIQSHES